MTLLLYVDSLVDVVFFFFTGADLDSLPSYGKRLNRIHVNNREFHTLFELA